MIKAYAKSDIGKVREKNQDSYYISDSLSQVQLYMLADGMGGYKGGEIASSLAIQSAKNYIENNFKEIEKDRDSIIQLVGSSIEYANMVVYEKSKESKELFTRKLTQDHSYVQKLVKDGTITKEEAKHHPQKNMLMKALGCNAFVEPDVMVKGFLKEDILIINSDGLTNLVSQEEIFREAKKDIEQAPKELVRIANENGGYDNITVIVIKNI